MSSCFWRRLLNGQFQRTREESVSNWSVRKSPPGRCLSGCFRCRRWQISCCPFSLSGVLVSYARQYMADHATVTISDAILINAPWPTVSTPSMSADNRLRYRSTVTWPPMEEDGRFVFIGVARILSAVYFVLKKSWRPLLVVTLKRRFKTTKWASKSPKPSKKVLKIDSCSAWEVHLVCWGALTNFPCKLRLIFSLPCGGSRCTQWTPWLRLGLYYNML